MHVTDARHNGETYCKQPLMRFLTDFLVALLVAAWLVAIATISIQNIDPVSLQFLGLRSIPLPFGILLAFSVGAGAIAAAVVPRLLFLYRR